MTTLRNCSKMGGAAAAVLLLACMVVSNPANATTFTLADLEGSSFTIGNLEFFGWNIDVSTVDTNQVTVETVDSEILPGFVMKLNGQMTLPGPGAGFEDLVYTFSVRTLDMEPVIDGSLLWVNNFNVMPNQGETSSEIEVTTGPLSVLLDANTDDASNAGRQIPPVNELTFASRAEVRLTGPAAAGPAALDSYATLFSFAVPEPATTLLLGLGLAGLGVVRRSRREER